MRYASVLKVTSAPAKSLTNFSDSSAFLAGDFSVYAALYASYSAFDFHCGCWPKPDTVNAKTKPNDMPKYAARFIRKSLLRSIDLIQTKRTADSSRPLLHDPRAK